MNGDSERTVNVKASINGRELSPERVTSLLGELFKDGWLEDVVRSALSAPSAAMDQVNKTVSDQVSMFKERLERAINSTVSAAASAEDESSESSEESKQGEDE